jgi:putative molybdopterin biosynthesis protein
MTASIQCSVLAFRTRRGWTQSHLGDLVGISRQSLAAIESGRAVPSTDVALRLARAFGVPLEELFHLPDDDGQHGFVVDASGIGAALPGRIRTATVAGRSFAYGLGADDARGPGPADGLGEPLPDGRVRVHPLPAAPPAPDLVVAGCDPAFGLVRERLRRDHRLEVLWISSGSRAALEALARGVIHVAGIHLRDPETGLYNAPWIRRIVPFPTTRVSFATWEQVLLLAPGNPLGIRGLADMARPEIRFVNRESGSGSRALAELRLAELGIPAQEVPGFLETAAAGHDAVGSAIASGAANAGVAIRAAGAGRGLAAIPLAEEPYELVIPSHFLELPAVEALLGVLRRPELRRQVEALGGYDASAMGGAA